MNFIISYIDFKLISSVLIVGLILAAFYYKYVLKGQIVILHKATSNQPIQQGTTESVPLPMIQNKVLSGIALEEKDSLCEHLNILSSQLAEKESKAKISKSRMLGAEFEMESLQAINSDVRTKYQDIMDNLKRDLQNNESECKRLQQEIEWVSKKRGELRDEVRLSQHMFGKVATDLTMNLTELGVRGRIVDKPAIQTNSALRNRSSKSALPKVTPVASTVMKSVPESPDSSLSRVPSPIYYQ